MSAEGHRERSPARVRVAVVTVSDTRTEENDASGQTALALLREAGHTVAGYRIVRDEPAEVRALLVELCAAEATDAIVLNGGTGLGRRDSTYEAVAALLDKRLDGFGELFRMLSFAEIGAAAMLSRAVAGVHRGVAIFAVPGAPAAVRLALARLILPELGHVVGEIRR